MRTKKTLLNMLSDVFPMLVMGILGFVKIRVFIEYLGKDYYGFTQLFNQIFGYLNLAEAGFTTAIIFALYEPIANRNIGKINSLISGGKIIFRRIGYIIILIGLTLSFFIDFFVKNNPMTPLYTQLLFIIYLITSTGNYFVFAPRFLLQADQNKYYINIVVNTTRIVQILVEIVLLMKGFGLMVIFTWYFVVMLITNWIVNAIAYKKYPWIDTNSKPDMTTVSTTKHVFMHRIGSIIALNTDNVVLSAFVGIEVVGIYASYNYIEQFIIKITSKIVNSTQESFGNYFASKEGTAGADTFWELHLFSFYMASVVFTVTYISINDFIRLWVGPSMVVGQITVLLFCVIFFYRIVRNTSLVIVNSIGAFKETKWQSLLEGIINLTLSVSLVQHFGINGVLSATIISYLLTGFWFIPNYVFNNVFKQSAFKYYGNYLLNTGIIVVLLYIAREFCQFVGFYRDTASLGEWFVDSLIFTAMTGLAYFGIYCLMYKRFRTLLGRFKWLISKAIRRV